MKICFKRNHYLIVSIIYSNSVLSKVAELVNNRANLKVKTLSSTKASAYFNTYIQRLYKCVALSNTEYTKINNEIKYKCFVHGDLCQFSMNQCFNFVKAEGKAYKTSKNQLFKNFKPIQNECMKLDLGIYFLNVKTGRWWLTFACPSSRGAESLSQTLLLNLCTGDSTIQALRT